MKKLIVLCFLLTLVGCSKSDSVEKYGSDVLNVFNSSFYRD